MSLPQYQIVVEAGLKSMLFSIEEGSKMRFLVNRDHTYTQGFAHTDPPEMYNTMPDAIIIKRGMYLQVELGPEETKITMPDGTKHSVSTSTFYWTVGSGCFNVDVTFKERPW